MKKSQVTYIENILSYSKRKPSFKHLPCKNLLKEILSLEKWNHTQTEAQHFKFTDFSQIRELQCNKPSKKSAASDGSFRAVRNHSVVQWFKAYFICHPPLLKSWGSAAGWDLSACPLPQPMNWHLNPSKAELSASHFCHFCGGCSSQKDEAKLP